MANIVAYEAAELALQRAATRGPTLAETMVPVLYKDTKWASRKIGEGLKRAYRRRKNKRGGKRARYTQVGEPMKNIHAKREQTSAITDFNTDTRTLYDAELTVIAQGDNEDQRNRHLINCKGIEIAVHFYNKNNQPLFVNMAVVAPKHGSTFSGVTEFFRSNNGDRGQNFGTSLSGLELHYLPINTDKYTILTHQRMQLGSESDATGTYNSDAGKGNWMSKKQWLPINRQLRFENSGSVSCTTPIYFVWWCDRMRTPALQAAAVNQMSTSIMHTMFFTDVL